MPTGDDPKRRAARLERLVHASHLFAEGVLDAERLPQLIAEHVAGEDGDACTLRLLSPDGAQLRAAAVQHPDPEVRAALWEVIEQTSDRANRGAWQAVIEERRTFRAALDGEPPPGLSAAQLAFLRRFPACGVVAAPLIARGRVIGGIALTRFGAGPPPTAEDEAYLADLAERAALAIDNARLYREALAQAEAWRALVENALDIISRFDRDLRHLYVNPAVERATGRPASTMIGKSNRELGMPEPLVTQWELVLRQVFRSGQERTIELSFSSPTGERRYQARIVPELGPDGSVATALAIARDVTAEWQAARERSELLRALVERDRRLQELVSRLLQDRDRDALRVAAVAQLEPTTPREREILRLMADGLTNQQIGRQLGLSAGTIKNHVARLLEKLGVPDRTAAAVRAIQLGLVETR